MVTLGPNSLRDDVISKIAEEPLVYLFRINLSHTPLQSLESVINAVRKCTNIPICLDSEGAQIRNQTMKNGGSTFCENDTIKIYFERVAGDSHSISFYPEHVARELVIGDRILIDFNSVYIEVIEKYLDHCLAKVLVGGFVGSNKAVNVERRIYLPPLTDKDKQALQIGVELDIRHFALSHANSDEDVELMRNIVGRKSTIISKIENCNGVRNLDKIIEASDMILLDRGDLSREVRLEKIPFLQRRIVSLARSKMVPVYVATNLLESMVVSRSPSRAEINDVVSTLLMGANGLVLAAETAIGNYPVEAVIMIRKLINQFKRWTPNTSIEEILEE
jgi:pyruvate kinase